MTPPPTKRRLRIRPLRPAHYLLFATLLVAPQLIGGAPAWATVALASLSAVVSAATYWLSRKHVSLAGSSIEPLALVQAVIVALTMLQVLPLPARATAWIAPDAYANAVSVAEALRTPAPSWVPLSMDPGGSLERLLFGLAVLCMFSASRLLARATSRSAVLVGVATSTLLVSFVALAHLASGATKVFGVYEPRFRYPPVWGPLMNPNNLAGMMALGVPVMLGLASRNESSRSQRTGWLIGSGLALMTAILTLSRGGIAASVLGVLVFGALHAFRSDDGALSTRAQRVRACVVIAGVLVGAAVLALGAGGDPLAEDYKDLTKLQMFGQEAELLGSHPWLGVGRGAFASVSAGVYKADGHALYAENLFLQLAIELGIPFAILAVGVGAWRLLVALISWRSPLQLGGLVGVLTLVLQNMFDFSLELTGVAIVAASCLGAALPSIATSGPSTKPARASFFSLRSLTGAAGVLTLAACLVFGSTVAATDARTLEREFSTGVQASDVARFDSNLERAVTLHPADPGLALIEAVQAVRHNAPSAPVWLNRSMSLAPFWSAPHAWAAHWLASVGQWDQALTELQLAAARNPLATKATFCALLKARPSADTAFVVVPAREPERTMMLEYAVECIARPSEQARLDESLLSTHPGHPAATSREARRDLERGDWQGALHRLEPLLKAVPPDPAVYDAAAQAWIAGLRPETAVALLEGAMPRFEDPYVPLLVLANAQAHAGSLGAMRETIDRVRGASNGDLTRLTRALAMLATLELQTGNPARSLRLWKELYSIQHDPFALSTAAQLAKQLGDDAYVRQAAAELCSEHASAGYCKVGE